MAVASPAAYLNFDLLITRSGEQYRAYVVDAPGGDADVIFSLPITPSVLSELQYPASGYRHSQLHTSTVATPQRMEEIGQQFYHALFQGQVNNVFIASRKEAERSGASLRIRLRFSDDTTELATLPWELLYDPVERRFLSLSESTPILRYLALPYAKPTLLVQPPLRVLAVLSSPRDYAALDIEREWQTIQAAMTELIEQGQVVLERLEKPTLGALQDRLLATDTHILHFVGHGIFDTSNQKGSLLFGDVTGDSQVVSAEELAYLLHNHRSLRLAYLNACEGAIAADNNIFTGVAQTLVQQGVSAAIAMQAAISDVGAIELVRNFYTALAHAYPVDAALTQARVAMAAMQSQEWAIPVLFSRSPDNRLFDLRDVLPTPNCPYPGMVPFTEQQAAFFFGRNKESRDAVERLRQYPFLTIVGSSGSGKSSLINAGIIPALKKSPRWGVDGWDMRSMRPGQKLTLDGKVAPLLTLATILNCSIEQLATVAFQRHTLLFIDQFEELFTLTAAEDILGFRQALLSLVGRPNLTMIIAVRADFYPEMMTTGALWERIKANRLELTSLGDQELRTAIIEPAAQVGVTIDEVLVERLVADAAGELGVLPLVQETLVLLWESVQRRHLTLAAYAAMSDSHRTGLQVAIDRRADITYNNLSTADQTIARRLFLRLVQFGEGHEHTRRQLAEDALRSADDDPAHFETTLQRLADSRLLTLSGDEGQLRRVDISHEALIAGWGKLQGWIQERSNAEQLRRRLEDKAQEWVRLGQTEGGLLDAYELYEAEGWLNSPDAAELGVSAQLRALAQASRIALDASAAEKEAIRQHQLRQEQALSRRLRWLIAALTGILVLAIVTGFWIDWERRRANNNALQARSQELVAQAQTTQQTSNLLERSMLLALELLPSTAAAQAEELLRQGLTLLPVPLLPIEHGDTVTKVAFSPDGKWIASASLDRTVQIRSVETGAASIPPLIHQSTVYGLAISPHGQIATGTGTGEVSLWALDTGRKIDQFSLGGEVYYVTFSPDGQWLAAASSNGIARVWETETQQEFISISHKDRVNKITFSADNHWVATASNDGVVTVWDLVANKKVVDLPHQGQVFQAVFSPDGTKLATATSDFNAYIWDVATRQVTARLHHYNWVEAVAFSPDGTKLATASDDYLVRLWEVASGLESLRMQHDDVANIVHFDKVGQRLVSASNDHTARVWDTASGQEIARLIHEDIVNDVIFDPSGERLATASADHTARVWALVNPAPRMLPHDTKIWDMAFSPDGRQLATASDDNFTARLWDLKNNTAPVALPTHGTSLQAVALSPDGQWLATGGAEGRAYLVQLANQTELPTIDQVEAISALAFSPDSNWLATGSVDKGVRVWDMAAKLQIRPLYAYTMDARVTALVFARQHPWLASAGGSASVRDLVQRQTIFELSHENATILTVAFNPAETMLATGESDGRVRFWDVATRSEITTSIKHEETINTLAFSPDGQWLATGSADNTARLWEIASGQEVTRLQHRGPVERVAFSPDGQLWATTSNNVLHLWAFDQLPRVDKGDLAETVCKRLTRNLTTTEWNQYFRGEKYRPTCSDLSPLENYVAAINKVR